MKKLMTTLGAVLLSCMLLVGCGGSIESDAKKVADLQCKAQKLASKASSGDMSVITESSKLALEAESLVKEIERKYTSESDKEKFSKALLKAMSNCN